MLDNEDLKWITATTTELNAALQQISRYSDLARQHKGDYKYITLLGERVELASKTAQALFDRVTSKILEGNNSGAARPTPAFKVLRAAAEIAPPIPEPVFSTPEQAGQKTQAVLAAVTAKAAVTPLRSAPPAPQAAVATVGELPGGKEIKNPNGRRELILLVDDEKEIAELAGEMLVEEGYKVIVAHDGFEALKIYQQVGKGIGLVILDFFLPVIDGDAIFDELRELNPKVNVVLSSGFGEQSKLSQMLAQGLRGFIPKPYTREKLISQVRSTLDSAGKVP